MHLKLQAFIRAVHLFCGSVPAEEDILSSCGSWGEDSSMCVRQREAKVFLNTNLMQPAETNSPHSVEGFYTAATYT